MNTTTDSHSIHFCSLAFILISLIAIVAFTACEPGDREQDEHNPPIEGFNREASDDKAIRIADEVMKAMGGREAWDKARYFSWVFFGSRKHYWDKYTGDILIESSRDSLEIQMNINDPGIIRLTMKDIEVTHTDSLQKYWDRGKSWWINDMYWLFMPYKLKDSGVSLKYGGLDTTLTGDIAHQLVLTFQEVGRTPDNLYKVYVDTSSQLVVQWDYYGNSQDSVPRFQLPWTNYQNYSGILLSGDRGDRLKITDISASDSLASYVVPK